MDSNIEGGFTWTIKELLPIVLSLLTGLGGLVAVYTTMSNRISILEIEIVNLRKDQSYLAAKMEILSTSATHLTKPNSEVSGYKN